MPPSRMMTSVALASVLDVMDYSASEVLYKRVFEAFEEKASTMENFTFTAPNAVGTVKPTIISNSTGTGISSMTGNATTINGADAELPFYGISLAREAVIIVVVNIMLYYWNIWLERKFPTRSRPAAVESIDDKTEKLTDEQVEEEIVKKWIAKGKVKRASVNWGNTLVKWALCMSVACVAEWFVRQYLLQELVNFRNPWHKKWGWVSGLPWSATASWTFG